MTSAFVWRIAAVAFAVGVIAGFVTVAVRGQPSVSVALAAYDFA